MNLTTACVNILNQLVSLVSQVSEAEFVKQADTLNNSTIGQHLRHTLEFFICFEKGYEKGHINYDKRSHDMLLENDKFLALGALEKIREFVQHDNAERPLKLEVGYGIMDDSFEIVDTNYTRELVYNIEHAVHHMAIIKIGVREVCPHIKLPADFGIAASTLRHKEAKIIA